MIASTKVIHVRALPVGAEKPSVVTDEPLISNECCHVPESVPQKMRPNPMMTDSIHTSGRLTSATGAYSPRRWEARVGFRPSWTRRRSTTAKVTREIRVNELRGRTTVSTAETSTPVSYTHL